MNHRLTVTAAIAVILASVSIYPLIQGTAWFWIGVGAVVVAAAAGTITRLPTLHATVAAAVLALIVCAPLLTSPSWFGKAVGVVLVAITAASRPRIRGTRAFAWLVTYAAALLIYLNGVFAGGLSVAGIVPTASSLHHLWTLAVQGLSERAYAPPVLGTHGIDLVAAAGIGVMAAATDFLAVRMRSPAIAGLPLLALYSVRITTNAKQGGTGATLVFCFGIVGYLALLAADGRERLRIWGRLVTVWHGADDQGAAGIPADTAESPDTRALAASGRRIGLAAACIALAFPLLVPGIRVHDLFASSPSGPGNGAGNGGPISLPNPLVQMHAQLLNGTPETVLTFRTTARVPQDQYLQIYVLNYDAAKGEWTLVPPQRFTRVKDGPLRNPPGLAASTFTADATTKIKLDKGVAGYGSKEAFLPLPYAPTSLRASGNWVEDNNTLMVYSAQPRAISGLSYTVDSSQPEIGKQQIDRAPSYPAYIRGTYLQFPASAELATLAQTITKDAPTPYQKALALQNWFLTPGRFKYNLQSDVDNNTGGLIKFLTKTRSGFCQQFASAMAVLARELHIPSRVAVGYTAGTRQPNGTWKVTTDDAHVWPELYFTGVGWIRFEPTPGGLGGQGTATEPQYAPPPGIPKPTPTPTLGAGAAGARNKAGNLAHNLHPLAGGGGGGAIRAGIDVAGWVLLGLAILFGLALITPRAARTVIRRRRLAATGDAGLAHAAWLELRDNLADYGFACRPSESPRAVASRIAATLQLDPAAREALGRIVSAEERASYATVPLSSQTLRADTATVRRSLSQEATWQVRWRARLLPPSTLRAVRPGLQHALDIFGWMDAAGLRIRRAWPGHSAPPGRA